MAKILKFKETSNIRRKRLLMLEEKERKMGLNPDLKKWWKLRDQIRAIKRKLS